MESFFIEYFGISSEQFRWFVLPAMIFLARVSDVSIATVRIMFVMNGKRKTATFLGFFESLIWLLAIGQIFQYINNPISYVAYAGGYATGTFVGMLIEGKLAVGMLIVRAILPELSPSLLTALSNEGFGYTLVDARGSRGNVKILFSVVERKRLPRFIERLRHYHPKAFYTVEQVRAAQEGIFPTAATTGSPVVNILRGLTKRK